VHRDLKPANVLVSQDGRPKVLDFGIARATGLGLNSTLQTSHGQWLGTLAFMSPEQLRGATDLVDERSDVYALGVMLYRLIAGRLPFDVGDLPLLEAAQRILNTNVARLGLLSPEAAGPIEVVVARAMSSDRAPRYQSAADMAADLRACLEGRAPASTRINTDSPHTVVRVHTAESADRRLVAVGLINGTVVILDAATGARTAAMAGNGAITRLAFEDDGRLAIERADGRVDVIDVAAAP
jgi:serine/threonine protein kinase